MLRVPFLSVRANLCEFDARMSSLALTNSVSHFDEALVDLQCVHSGILSAPEILPAILTVSSGKSIFFSLDIQAVILGEATELKTDAQISFAQSSGFEFVRCYILSFLHS